MAPFFGPPCSCAYLRRVAAAYRRREWVHQVAGERRLALSRHRPHRLHAGSVCRSSELEVWSGQQLRTEMTPTVHTPRIVFVRSALSTLSTINSATHRCLGAAYNASPRMSRARSCIHRESKKQDTQLLPITSPNIDRFSKFFHG